MVSKQNKAKQKGLVLRCFSIIPQTLLHYFFVSMVTVPGGEGGKDYLKVFKKPIISRTTLDKPQWSVPTRPGSSPSSAEGDWRGNCLAMWFFMTGG